EVSAAIELRLHGAEVYVLVEANLGKWLKATSRERTGRPKKTHTPSMGLARLCELGITDPRRERCLRLAEANGRLEKALQDIRTTIATKAREWDGTAFAVANRVSDQPADLIRSAAAGPGPS